MDVKKLSTDDGDARSLFSMQELDPSPVDDLSPNLESGGYFQKPPPGQDLLSPSSACEEIGGIPGVCAVPIPPNRFEIADH